MINFDFNSVIELVRTFKDEDICVKHLELMRWNGNPVSPFDPGSKVYKCKGERYRCKNTGKYFNVKTGTLFDNTKIELQTWFVAIFLITTHSKGISSMQLSKDLNVTQKTAWFMLQRIRNCFGLNNENENGKMGGGGQIVEVDETYVGGKMKNMHLKKRGNAGSKFANDNKTMVMGYLVRGGNLKLEVVPKRKEILNSVKKNIEPDSVLITDMNTSYNYATQHFASHQRVDHGAGEYVKDKTIHTNGIEGAFSMFDRMVIGTYHYISQKHMQKYADELSFRYNWRKDKGHVKFNELLANSSKRITYKTLIGKA